MAQIMVAAGGTPGSIKTLFVRYRRSDDAVWYVTGAAWEAYNPAHIAGYEIAATEVGTATGKFKATDPDPTTEGYYLAVERAGGALVEADLLNGLFWEGTGGPVTAAVSGGGDPWATDLATGGYTGTQAGAIEQLLLSRIGTPAGASVSADIAEIEAETDDIGAIKAKTDLIGSGTGTVVQSPISTAGAITILVGNDYYAVDGQSIDLTIPAGYASIQSGAPSLRINLNGTNLYALPGTVVTYSSIGDPQEVRVEVARASTSVLRSGTYEYYLDVLLADGHNVSPLTGVCYVRSK